MADSSRILWLTAVGHATSHAWELIFPAVAIPMSRDLGLSFAETVRLSFPMYLCFGLGAPVSGWLADRFGARAVLLAGLVGGGFAGVGILLASSPSTLTFALALLGLAASLYHPAGLALLSQRFADRQGRAFALNGMAGNVGIAATPLLAGLFASLLGWRATFLVLCLPGLVAGGVFLALPWRRTDVGQAAGEGAGAAASQALAPESTGLEARMPEERPRWRALLGLSLAVMAAGLAYRIHTLVVPALLQERLVGASEWFSGLWPALTSADNLAATALTSAAYAAGIVGQWWGGRVADTRPLGWAYVMFHLAALGLVLLASVATGLPLLLVLFVYLFFTIGTQPIENSLVARLTPGRWRARAYAAKFVLAFGVGSLGVPLVGWLIPLGGLAAPLWVSSGLEVVVVLAVVWVGARALLRPSPAPWP